LTPLIRQLTEVHPQERLFLQWRLLVLLLPELVVLLLQRLLQLLFLLLERRQLFVYSFFNLSDSNYYFFCTA
jgi:hypothetical protein